jgi:hypothetical protein
MIDSRELYRDYIFSINSRLHAINIKISQYQASIAYIKNSIINNKELFTDLGVSLESIFSAPVIAYSKIKPLVNNGQLTKVAHYVKSYSTAHIYLSTHKTLYDRLSKAIIPYEVFISILTTANFEITKYILNGGIYTFGHLGRMFIKEKPRTFFFKGCPAKLPVDWGNSIKYREHLIKQGKELYNAAKNPNGNKWHLYHDSDFANWVIWQKSIYLKNRHTFRFYPSNFRKRDNKKPFTSKEEILNSTEIGFVNKMHELVRFDASHSINYRRPELETRIQRILQYVNR